MAAAPERLQCWDVVGGAEKGGIVVREAHALSSPALGDRLAHGARVEELHLVQDRLHYRKVSGKGPPAGWVSTRASGRPLLERSGGASGGGAGGPAPAAAGVARPPAAANGNPAAKNGSEAHGQPVAKQSTEILTNGVVPAARAADAKPPAPKPPTNVPNEAAWVTASKKKMQDFHEGTPVRPPAPDQLEIPARLKNGNPRDRLTPFKRLVPAQMEKMSKLNLPGDFTGDKFPHSTDQLKSFGPEWYTKAFHAFGTLPKDNRVTKVVHCEQLPHSGFDAAGGAGHKAFITLEYAKPDPDLHTELFAKFPWYYDESETAKGYRMQLSAYSDSDAPELLTYVCCEHLFPFRIPKLYFCDISRETTNYMLITERVKFGRRGKLMGGRVVEKVRREPYDLWPVCGKYQDYLLEDPPQIYFCIMREMAHLAAWDHVGQYDSYFGAPLPKYTPAEFLASQLRKPAKERMMKIRQDSCRLLLEKGEEFALKIAPQIFTPRGKDPKMIKKMMEDIVLMAPHFEDIRTYLGNNSDFIGAMHMNLQADNGFFWADETGSLDMGVFDWSGFSRSAYVMNFMGCLSGAEADMLDAHEEGLMRMFCDEFERYGGPRVDWRELLMRYHLQWPAFVMDCCQWIERDILKECPLKEWPTVTGIHDDKFVNRWNVRCRGTTLINAFEFWPRRDFAKIFNDWKDGVGKPYLTAYTA